MSKSKRLLDCTKTFVVFLKTFFFFFLSGIARLLILRERMNNLQNEYLGNFNLGGVQQK